MATVPIVTEVTLAQLEALVAANGLNDGLQYRILDTNIDWLLVADSNSTLKSAIGVINITNTIVLPAYIIAPIALIVCGNITTDISGTAFEVVVPANFIPTLAYIKPHHSALADVTFTDSDQDEIYSGLGLPNYEGCVRALYLNADQYVTDSNVYVKAVGNVAAGFELIVKCEFSPFI